MSLFEEAAQAEAAADLLHGNPAERARALIDVLGSPALADATPRALWNLLWLAGELSVQVDVYTAAGLLAAVEGLFTGGLSDGDAERVEVVEMTFDFFFNRPPGEQPLVAARLDETLAVLRRILALPAIPARRAALHGLGHVRQQLDEGQARERVDALFDSFLRETDSTALAQYAARARAGELL